MNQINQYFEASDNAEYVFFDSPHQCICKVTAGTVRGIAAGAMVYAAAPRCIAIAAVAGSSAIAMAPDALAIALVAGSSASAAADGAYADALDAGSLAQAFVAGAIAKTQIGTALGLAAGAWVIEKYPPSNRERDVPGVIYSNSADNFSVAREHGIELNPSPWPTKIDDECSDLGVIIAYDMYHPPGGAYPWQNDYCYLDDRETGGYSIAMTGRQILDLGYTGPGMKLRDAIRHAEILGDTVPGEAYEKLQTLCMQPVEQRLGETAANSHVTMERRFHQCIKDAWKHVNESFTSDSAKQKVGAAALAPFDACNRTQLIFALQAAWPFVHGCGDERLIEEARTLGRYDFPRTTAPKASPLQNLSSPSP